MRLLFVLIPFLLSTTLVAQDELKDEFIQKISFASQNIESINSDFEQTQEISVLSRIEKSTGKFYFKNPGMMKWEQVKPSGYYFLFNGSEAYRYDGIKKEKLPSGSPQVAGFKKFLMGIMNGSIFQDENFTNSFSRTEEEINVEMIPQKKMLKRRFDKISLTFDYDRMILLDFVFHEAGGDKRSVRFFNHKLNTLTDISVFQ